MAIYVYPPVSLSITSGPEAFTIDGVVETVNVDTVDPSNTKGLPVNLYDPDGVRIYPATDDSMLQIYNKLFDIEVNQRNGIQTTKLMDAGGSFELGINAGGEASVHDTDAKTAMENLLTELQLKADLTEVQPISLPAADVTKLANIQDSTDLANDLLGALNDTAPATDTASSSINGRLQRIAQRITSLITLFPTSLGSKADASSFAVTLATEDKAIVGSLTETAPASDTASSGLNGRLQRIAQRLTSLIGLLPSSLGSKADASSLAVTWATEDKAALGSITETAPASDTASSGLNGRLQRIAQRLTSLIGLLPAALGQGTMAQSLRVVLASDQTTLPVNQSANTPTYNQDLTVNSTTVVTLNAPAGAKGAKVWADKDNGQALRVTMDGSTTPTSTVGFRFEAGRSEDFIGVGSLKVLSEGSGVTAQAIYVQWRV